MNENATEWVMWAIEILQPLILALVGLGSAYLVAYIRAKVRNQQLETVLVRLTNAADRAVRSTEQTLVRSLKAKSEDGKLSATDAKAAARAALTTLQNLAGPVGLREADAVLGDSSEWLRALLEAKVDELKGDK